MKKKVQFDDNVQIKYMSVSLKDHIREVKDPTNSLSSDTSPKTDTPYVFWWWVLGIIICVIILLAWCYFLNIKWSIKNAKKNIDE